MGTTIAPSRQQANSSVGSVAPLGTATSTRSPATIPSSASTVVTWATWSRRPAWSTLVPSAISAGRSGKSRAASSSSRGRFTSGSR
jgi:hypothetical protein